MLTRILQILLTLASLQGYGQVDTEFWFAPPDVTSGHGDRPIYLRVSTLDKASVVTVTQPASNFLLGQLTVPPNTTQTLDLTFRISSLETSTAAFVMTTGIRISSSEPITAYYEVGSMWNSDIFILKGRNALGNKFIIPAQDFYNNSGDYSPTPRSSFDIVASQNNTVVKVRPTKPIFGHERDSVITVKLNAGETYSFRKVTLLAIDNPAGTIVESNKPIAITLKDDSVINTGCRDLLGDQLVPVAVAGLEYVVLKGFLDTPEYLFITATEDDTKVYMDGAGIPVATLSMGELFRYHITSKAVYIVATKTIYVFHVTGFGCEIGMAILPSINCKGSDQIGFSRTTDEFFGLNILVRKDGISHFKLNNSTVLIPASAFSAVPGTNDKWYQAQLSFSTSQIPVGQGSLISNSVNSFQVGTINGDAATTCRYGYFSSFSTLFIGDDYDICEGGIATLDAGPGKESYLWSTGQTSERINVSTAGEYWVKVEREECVLYDTVKINVKKGKLDLGPDRLVCRGDTTHINGKENFSWVWSDGSRNQFLITQTAGKYWLSVSDYTGCLASDTIVVALKDVPVVDLGVDKLKCRENDVTLNATFPGATYTWNDGSTAASRSIHAPGDYWVKLSWNGCSATDSIRIENLPGPLQDSIFGSPSICPFATAIDYRVEATPNSTYQWFVKGGSIKTIQENKITVDWFGTNSNAEVKVLITDGLGCKGDSLLYPVRINVALIVEIPIGPDTLCVNKSQQVVYGTPNTNGSVYQWNISGGEITEGQGSPGVIINWTEGQNKLWIQETSVTIDTVCTGTSDELSVYVFQDMTNIKLNYVTVDTIAGNTIQVNWKVTHPETVLDNRVLLNKSREDEVWQIISALAATTETFTDDPGGPIEDVSAYYLSLTNLCDQNLVTAVHNTMILTGAADTVTDRIGLRWNHYQGWTKGVNRYEVWRKLDNEPGYRFVASVGGNEVAMAGILATDGFEHRYVIRAVEQEGPNESWSTPLRFEFEHPVTIPNIITPNGDGFDEYFHISKIEIYRTSDLTITDRWGKRIFHVVNYQNDWDGASLASGVYFYELDLRRNHKKYRGTLSILR
jgi:gliding motility-associated-like protein